MIEFIFTILFGYCIVLTWWQYKFNVWADKEFERLDKDIEDVRLKIKMLELKS